MSAASDALDLLLSIVDARDEASAARARRILASHGGNVQAAVDAWFAPDPPAYAAPIGPAPPPALAPCPPRASASASAASPEPVSACASAPQAPAAPPSSQEHEHDLIKLDDDSPPAESAGGPRRSERLRLLPAPGPAPSTTDAPDPFPAPSPAPAAGAAAGPAPGAEPSTDLIDLTAPENPPPYAAANGGADDDAALAQALAASLADVEGTSHLSTAPAASEPHPRSTSPAHPYPQPPPPLPSRPSRPTRPEVSSVAWRQPGHPPALVASHAFFQPVAALLQALYAVSAVRALVLSMHLPPPPIPVSTTEELAIDVHDLWRGKPPVWSVRARTGLDTSMPDAPGPGPNDAMELERSSSSSSSADSSTPDSIEAYIQLRAGETIPAADLALLRNVQVLFAYLSSTQRAWIQVPNTLAGLSESDTASPWSWRWNPVGQSVWSLYGRLSRALEKYADLEQRIRSEVAGAEAAQGGASPPAGSGADAEREPSTEPRPSLFSLSTRPASGKADYVSVSAVGITGVTVPAPSAQMGDAGRVVAEWATQRPVTYALYQFLQRSARRLVAPPRVLVLFSVGNGVEAHGSSGGGATARLLPSLGLALLDEPEEKQRKAIEHDLLPVADGAASLPELSATPAPFVSEPVLSIGALADLPAVSGGGGEREARARELASQLGNLRKWKSDDPKDLLDTAIAYFERIAAPVGAGAAAAAASGVGGTRTRPPATQASRADAAQKTLAHLVTVRAGLLRTVEKRQKALAAAQRESAQEALEAARDVALHTAPGPRYRLAGLVVPRGPGLFPPSASAVVKMPPNPSRLASAGAWGHIRPALDEVQDERTDGAEISVMSDEEAQAVGQGAVVALYEMDEEPGPGRDEQKQEQDQDRSPGQPDEGGDGGDAEPSDKAPVLPLVVRVVQAATAADNAAIIADLAAAAAAQVAAQRTYSPPAEAPPDVEMREASAGH